MYPRYEFFKAVTEVFRADGRTTPVFSDKHLSYDYDRAVEMVEISKEMGFAFLAGSSLPCGYRMPALELAVGTEVHEALVVTNLNGGDGGWFHGLEALQCMTERRSGGETGVASVHATAGDAVWPQLEAGLAGCGSWDDGGVDPELLEGCLCRSQQLRNIEEIESKPADGTGEETSPREPLYSWRYPTAAKARTVVEDPRLIRIRYRDGTRASVLFVAGLVADTTFAARLASPSAQVVSTLLNNDTIAPLSFRNFGTSSRLMEAAEDMFITGKTRWPIERNLLTTGLTAAAAESFHTLEQAGLLATPQLDVCYQPK